MRKKFGSKRDDVRDDWRRVPNEQLNDLCASRSIILVTKSRRMRWSEHRP